MLSHIYTNMKVNTMKIIAKDTNPWLAALYIASVPFSAYVLFMGIVDGQWRLVIFAALEYLLVLAVLRWARRTKKHSRS